MSRATIVICILSIVSGIAIGYGFNNWRGALIGLGAGCAYAIVFVLDRALPKPPPKEPKEPPVP